MKRKIYQKCCKILNSHPGISHNYERNHSFNIWFTIAIAPNSNLGLEKSIEILAKKKKKKNKCKNYIILPTLKLFKISVKLDTTNKEEKQEKLIQKVLQILIYQSLTTNLSNFYNKI